MKIQFSFVLALLMVSQSYGQIDHISAPSGFGNSYGRSVWEKSAENKNTEGTPYLNEEFIPSEILTSEGTLYRDVKLRYNIFTDEIEFLRKDEVRAMNSRDLTDYAIIGKDTVITKMKDKSGNMEYSHFLLLVSGNNQLLVKKHKIFREGKPAAGYQDETNPAFVDGADEFYLGSGDDQVARKFPKKKNVEPFFGELGAEVTKFMKKEKISLKKQDDLVKLLHYCNSIDQP